MTLSDTFSSNAGLSKMEILDFLDDWKHPLYESIYSSHLQEYELALLPKPGRGNHLGFATEKYSFANFSRHLDTWLTRLRLDARSSGKKAPWGKRSLTPLLDYSPYCVDSWFL